MFTFRQSMLKLVLVFFVFDERFNRKTASYSEYCNFAFIQEREIGI